MPGDIESEKSKAAARWLGIPILAIIMSSLWGDQSRVLFWGLVGGALAANAFHTAVLLTARDLPPSYKYLTVAIDLAFLTAAILYTGGANSAFFFAYFVILVSNCIRYGLLMSVYIATLVNGLYVAALAAGPEVPSSIVGGEGLKILAVWAVALYGGTVAARLRRQSYQLAAYEETIAELREALNQKGAAKDG